ncbi:MAG: (E)-4-hydroxy-3-methylbut-2-enyl-diphosphate synthase [Bacteroidales bacterium]|nr:(E)-4-hydroxy-3-methylbut-2-enyl-diphosphate synthase [Bacteroidales bacterium]MCF8343892.1 (E)-4-hydroxy-3-methylbut-2-enyl-diphosphate synthase [Bacteroidales bacterium]MCF8352360.1 (E)-4-hydroxy-3-methylbut-2-enyl-diphosphate synthase [Bacteroidales bacterium]MCF8377482.1 (E)-4-hydroxy-3-methylbut-2-enyl-diphosphate synthase [Bacteroidales bacterium]MCF8401605.1 (E)-4-hydroxy-3-methylbut-2-enyl-diphosphate synthase [Bacteroidales bacterium]
MNFSTRIVRIGDLAMGGNNPVRLQSMTNTDTIDTAATVEQCLRLIEAGCEIVRISAPSVKAAKNLAMIKSELLKKGFDTPLVADIHFNVQAATEAAKIVEKIRINPGNFIGNKRFASRKEELSEVSTKLNSLIEICRQHKTAMRIGVNHGSLSQSILHDYGNTAKGMVVSALEYIELCRSANFHELVISLKSSNIRVMIDAYRMLVQEMIRKGYGYPLHLGVTEAGDAEDGRIKSAAGIGTLLNEGIGDTIRVSLTEDPVREIPVARKIVEYAVYAVKAKPTFFYIPATENLTTPFVLSDDNKRADIYVKGFKAIDADGKEYPLLKEPAGESDQRILFKEYLTVSTEEFMVQAAMDFSPELLAGRCQGIWLKGNEHIPAQMSVRTAFDILQATGLRRWKTEYIACPSCARTLFNIEEALQEVKAATSHLIGLKIGVMGCVVNGPGEMADADYGYVGAGKDTVNLYKGKQLIKKNIPRREAVCQLTQLIHEHGDWQDGV